MASDARVSIQSSSMMDDEYECDDHGYDYDNDHDHDDHPHTNLSKSMFTTSNYTLFGHDDDDDDDGDGGGHSMMRMFMSGLSIDHQHRHHSFTDTEADADAGAGADADEEFSDDDEKEGKLGKSERLMFSDDYDDGKEEGRLSMGCSSQQRLKARKITQPWPTTSSTASRSGGNSPISNWRISSPGDDPRDVKARLKVWAQAVALASASTSPRHGS